MVAIGGEALFILVFVEWKTFYIRITGGMIVKGSLLHSKTFPLSDVDLVQVVYGKGQALYLLHGNRIALKVFGDLVGFDDLVGFMRVYANHHHVPFMTRHSWGTWS
jgi:hypothetical protein